MESIGIYKMNVVRHGRMDETVKVRLRTIDGSTVEEEDYKPLNETLTFEPNERTKEIGLEIVDDNQWHTAGSDTIFVQIYMDPPPGVPGVSKNQIFFFTNETVFLLR